MMTPMHLWAAYLARRGETPATTPLTYVGADVFCDTAAGPTAAPISSCVA
jgi:hypothetical protein